MVSDSREGSNGDGPQYDVTAWEAQTGLDRLAVWISRVVVRRWVALAAVIGVLLVARPLAAIGTDLVQYPWLSGVWLLTLLIGLLIIWYIRRIDSTPISLKLLAVTFLLGAAFAGFAVLAEGSLNPVIEALPVVGTAASFILIVGPAEELVKWAAVRLYAYERSGFQTALDGAVYGATAGLGFGAFESAVYLTAAVAQVSAGDQFVVLGASLVGAAGRLPAVPFHVLLTALSGYYLGLAKANQASYGPIVVKGLIIAGLLHGIYDTLLTYVGGFSIGVGVVYAVAVGLVLYRKLSRYRRRAPTGGAPTTTARS